MSKNIYIFEEVEFLTNSYHEGGGLVVIASDLDELKELVKVDKYIHLTESEIDSAKIFELKDSPPSEYFVFPDAGCC
jgi:hypothetical protein